MIFLLYNQRPQLSRGIFPVVMASALKKELKKKGKMTRGNMDIRTSLSIIPDPRIERGKKYL
jgi:hypothetical protein